MASLKNYTPDCSGSPEDISMDDKSESSPSSGAPPRDDAVISAALDAARGEGLTQNLRRFLGFLGVKEGEWTELQALDASGKGAPYKGQGFAHASTVSSACQLALVADEHHAAQGLYVVMNRVDARVTARGATESWHQQQKGASTSEKDILYRRAIFIDCDPERPSGISTTAEEAVLAHDRAMQVYGWLVSVIGGPAPLGFGMSGNGSQVYLATADLPADQVTKKLVSDLLSALDKRFTDKLVKVDTSVSDAKRVCPAFGTVKRKGSDTEERPHRRTYFACAPTVRRLSLDELQALVAAARPEAPAHGDAPRVRTSPEDAAPGEGLRTLNDLPIRDVGAKLGLDEEHPVCPWCGSGGTGTDVAFIEHNFLNCKHDRCSEKPNRTPVDLVAKITFGCDNIKGSKGIVTQVMTWFAENMGVDVRGQRGARSPGAASRARATAGVGHPSVGPVHGDDGGERPEIQVTTEEHIVNDRAAEALGADPTVYQRGYELVRILREDADTGDKVLKRTPGTPKISRMQRATLRERLAANARWVAAKKVPGSKAEEPEFTHRC
jgi:hypothetical protein